MVLHQLIAILCEWIPPSYENEEYCSFKYKYKKSRKIWLLYLRSWWLWRIVKHGYLSNVTRNLLWCCLILRRKNDMWNDDWKYRSYSWLRTLYLRDFHVGFENHECEFRWNQYLYLRYHKSYTRNLLFRFITFWKLLCC